MSKELVTAITLEDVQRAIPSRKRTVTQEIVDIINASNNEAEFQGESLIDTMTTYESVIVGRAGVGIKDYIHAIKFCAYLITFEDNYTEAYRKTFSSREFVKSRAFSPTDSDKYRELTTAASRYRRSKLVVDILTASQVPLHMLFTGARYKVLGVLLDRAENSRLDRDKINAAKEFLAATKGPDDLRIELDIGVKEDSATQNLMDQLSAIANRQQELVRNGLTTVSDCGSMGVKEQTIIDGEFIEKTFGEGNE